ncbi:MAG: cation:proton antiporter [Proteiniphilum sp.]|jgi:CPA2 family monovalent cation:H+ antiporter-2|uniref:cation:proton antiporter domain-containing protein n=1 Tax=Proteiniphilum sp. TaxID=1926877 RepID=UPI002B1F35A1|nr:cation:proton antiporter [Proteiniphilum sp.]MEA5128691.1 cation:proton antiporter [Proteiniphilum sp.]
MGHLPDFIGDLALILITASIATIIFKWLKQPIVLGYIVAGLLAGPYISWLPTVADMGNVSVWAEIGVIFLLFGLGLEFSFKKLIDVGGTASIATLINMGSMIVIGYFIGQLLGWSTMDSIFLGGMLSMSSTTIIIKAFNDMGLQKKKFASIVFGMLIVEDIAAIVMMALLSTVAISQHFEGAELFNSVLKLLFFILIWFVVGIYVIPTLLKKLKRYLNDETLLIVSVGLALGMVLFAVHVGFSPALGAFIMGSILAETIEAKRIEHVVEPLKNLFGAVFFVSVGMMINPRVIIDHIDLILLFTGVVLVGRIVFATLGVMASGQSLKISLNAGFSLAQIGEFSFIIATLGMTLGVISETLYPIIVAVSIITTFTTPYCIQIADPVSAFIEKKIPKKWNKIIIGYAASSYKAVNKQSDWNRLLKSVLTSTAIHFTLSIAVLLLFRNFVTPFIMSYVPDIWGRILSAFATLLVMSPFIQAMVIGKTQTPEFKNLWNHERAINRGAIISLTAVRVVLATVLVLMVLIPLFPRLAVLMVVIALNFITFIIFSQGLKKQSDVMETRFLRNFNEKQQYEEDKSVILPTVANALLNKSIHIEECEVPQLSPSAGKTLRELDFRERTGVNIVAIIRGSKKINIPGPDQIIYPFDRIVVAGSDTEIQAFFQYLEETKSSIDEKSNNEGGHHISVSQYIIDSDSSLLGKTIGNSNIREKTECMIIGIDREGQSETKLVPSFMFESGDILWLAGEKSKLNHFEDNIK